MVRMQYGCRSSWRFSAALVLAVLLVVHQEIGEVVFGADAVVKDDSVQLGPRLPAEIARFKPPSDSQQGELPNIYAVSARPMGIPTFPQYAVDDDPETSWSCKDRDQWLTIHIDRPINLTEIDIAFVSEGISEFHIETSPDGRNWTKVYEGASPATPGQKKTYTLQPSEARYLRITPHRISKWGQENWKSISEVKIPGLDYQPSDEMQFWSKTWKSGPPTDAYLANHQPVARGSYREVAAKALATLIEHGTDRYGPIHTPIWVLNLDLETLDCFPRYNDDLERSGASWLAPYGTGHRAIRPGQRPAGSSNLFIDQPMIRAAILHDLLAEKKTFTPAVAAYVESYCQRFFRAETGLLNWGNHLSQNVYSEDLQHDGGKNSTKHELLWTLVQWPTLHQMQPKIIGREMERFWYWHTDELTGETDRHSDAKPKGHGLPFAMSASEIALCCAYQHSQSPEGPWLDRALQIAHFHWDQRDKTTNLFVNTPDSSAKGRFDNRHADTTIPGPWASRIFMAGRLTGNQELADMVHKTLLAWAEYGWDEESQKPWASLLPDGTPNDGKRNYAGITYGKFDPSGHWDLWKDYFLGFEAPISTMLVYAMAADYFDDPRLTAHAVRLADYCRQNLPVNGNVGTMAANYGRLISFYLQMEQLTGDVGYRKTAEQVAEEALDHLWTGRLLRGFSGRTHYSASEGSGYLVQALLELDADPKQLSELREKNVFLWNF